MRDLAPILLAGYGAGLFAAAMPHPAMALGGILTLIGLGLMGLSLEVTLQLRGLPPLHLSRRPGNAAATYAPALLGCALGGLTCLAPTGPALGLALAVLLANLVASLGPRFAAPAQMR